MKKSTPGPLYLFISSSMLVALGIFLWHPTTPLSQQQSVSSSTPLPIQKETSFQKPEQIQAKGEIIVSGKTYIYQYINGKTIASHRLIGNFNTKQESQNIIKQYKCDAATSGGFYDTNNKPIGLFISDGKKIQEAQNNDLFIAFAWSREGTTVNIDESLPSGEISWALQSGPLLLKEGKPTTLSLKIDEPARRIVLALTKQKQFYLFVITQKNDELKGPPLTDLPKVMDTIQNNESLQFHRALNLDGGNHSLFFNSQAYIPEEAPIGSIICLFSN